MLTAGALTIPMSKGVRGHSSYQNPEGDGIYMDRAARQDLLSSAEVHNKVLASRRGKSWGINTLSTLSSNLSL